MGYKPSPRPSFDVPTVLRADEVVHHTWGDSEAGLVEDWVYVSSQLIHAIVFGMPPRPHRPTAGRAKSDGLGERLVFYAECRQLGLGVAFSAC